MTTSPTGYDLISAAARIVADIDDPEGALSEAIDARLGAWIEASDDKIGAYYAVNRRLAVEDSELSAYVDRLSTRRRHLARQREYVHHMATDLLSAREALGEESKVKRPEFSAWLQSTDSVLVETPVDTLPGEYQRLIPARIEADKPAIMRALKAGNAVDGCVISTSRSVRFR